ncbi:MAG: NERD domain-containing protein [Bacilli bacterium]|nr:NERD domain-containing protein [Bacilli bacterium]
MFTIILWLLAILSIIIVVWLYKNEKNIIGFLGEHWTKDELKKLPNDKYKVINNVFISINGNTHQIDHVIVSPYGIFSIETKQWNGLIIGNKYSKNWIKYMGKNKYICENPIRQNYGHVKSLSELLNIDESKIYNIVCIPSNAKLKIQHDDELVRNYTIVDKISSYKDIVIDNVDEIVDILYKINITDKNIKRKHINNIKNNAAKNNNFCPKCGGKLVERNGKYGKFIGCSNYPKCKYIEN